jgi:hypothetical protein
MPIVATPPAIVADYESPTRLPLGAMVGVFPGGVAVTYRVVEDPRLGFDVEANAEQLGLALSWGSLTFVDLGIYQQWGKPGTGILCGVGMRF